jgi:hypothetical protein
MKHASVLLISANYRSAAQHTHSKAIRKKPNTCTTHYKLQTAAAVAVGSAATALQTRHSYTYKQS